MTEYTGVPILSKLEDLPPVAAIIITDLGDLQVAIDKVVKIFGSDRVLVPQILAPKFTNKMEIDQ